MKYLLLILATTSSALNPGGRWAPRGGPDISNRKDFIAKSAAAAMASAVGSASAFGLVPPSFATEEHVFSAYKIIPDASPKLDPTLEQINERKFFNDMVKSAASKSGAAIWLGEHHNSERDHDFQDRFIRSVHEKRGSAPMAIGLEQVQLQFQPALDDYVQGKISLAEMKDQVQWERRWMWSFAGYEKIFVSAKKLNIRLLALNVDSEDLSKVEKTGYQGLSGDIRKYIQDPIGFGESAKTRKFSTYVDYVISPSYKIHDQLGLLQFTNSGERLDSPMPFRNFLCGRLLWDECMAGTAAKWTNQNPGGLLIGLVGADHVKFGEGIPGRYERLTKGEKDNTVVIINPTLIDSRPSGSVAGVADSASTQYPERITLQLRYTKEGVDKNSEARLLPENTGGVLGFADYIVIS